MKELPNPNPNPNPNPISQYDSMKELKTRLYQQGHTSSLPKYIRLQYFGAICDDNATVLDENIKGGETLQIS